VRRNTHHAMRMTSLCVTLHDVAPATWPACERVLRALDSIERLPLTLLVVPRYRGLPSESDVAFLNAVERRIAHGDEVALHGWTHVDDAPLAGPWQWAWRRVYTDGEGEFAALIESDAWVRLEAGRRWFARRGWPLAGFVPPAWLMSRGAARAIRGSGFEWFSDRAHVYLPRGAQRSTSLVWSSRGDWRRRASLLWNAALAANARNTQLLRLALHPTDADYDELRMHWQRTLKKLLVHAEPQTKRQFVRTMIDERDEASRQRPGSSVVTPFLHQAPATPTPSDCRAERPSSSRRGAHP